MRRLPQKGSVVSNKKLTGHQQGEPSDVETLAALEAYWGVGGSWSQSQVEKMRAALRAAGGVR